MTAARLVTVTLARAWDPADTAGAPGRIEFAIALDAQGAPDLRAWFEDPKVWPATRWTDGAEPETGDVAHDDEGWQLRFFSGARDPDAPAHRLLHAEAGLRPGAVLTLVAPEGQETTWRVVGVQ
ncbi:hypothetical protein [Falsiroseomonas sp. HW251]|uniref:hypothetical protein n=1 Tax=Falsiroseomonas sp. HW251 TaxID=3390998 RepID=UPI003D313761